MKKVFGVIILILVAVSAPAQVYDGITQPTTFRYWMPVNITTDSEVSAAPFIGLKHQTRDWISFTAVFQHNIQGKAFMPSLWVNANYKGKAFILLRNTYNLDTKTFSNTVSGTIRTERKNMIDFTWWNMQSGGEFFTGDRMQILMGHDFGRFVLNGGVALIGTKGFVTNLRLRMTDLSWIQLRYDTGTQVIGVSTAIHL